MNWNDILGGAARHSLTVAGGWLVHKGFLDQAAVPEFVGAGMVFAGYAWSWWDKRGRALAMAAVKADLDYWKGRYGVKRTLDPL